MNVQSKYMFYISVTIIEIENTFDFSYSVTSLPLVAAGLLMILLPQGNIC